MTQAKLTARLETRIAPASLAVIKRAAELQGRSMSDFVAIAAEQAAHQTIEDAHLIQLSVDDQLRFAELVIDPPALSQAMERAREAHTRLIRNSTNATVSG